MSPILSILLALLSRVKPEDVAAIVKEIVAFLDPIIAKRGLIVRSVWGFLRGSLAAELTKLIADVQAHPQTAAAASDWAI